MATGMKVNSKNAWNMVREYRDLQMAIVIKEITRMANLVDTGSTFGLQAVFSKDSLKMDWDLVRVFGKKDLLEVKNMKEDGREIKNKVMVCLLGLMELYTKVIL
jgi:hypothetical protein